MKNSVCDANRHFKRFQHSNSCNDSNGQNDKCSLSFLHSPTKRTKRERAQPLAPGSRNSQHHALLRAVSGGAWPSVQLSPQHTQQFVETVRAREQACSPSLSRFNNTMPDGTTVIIAVAVSRSALVYLFHFGFPAPFAALRSVR